MSSSHGNSGGNGSFRTTQWTAVITAGNRNDPEADAALAQLCETYWYPIYAYIRRRGASPEDAEDLTQEFFARLLQRNFLEGITREGGKFRSFLLTAVNRFLCNEWRRNQAEKRGGGKVLVSLDRQAEDRYRLEPVDEMTPEKLFERRWAFTLLDEVMGCIRDEYAHAGRATLFKRLQPYITGGADLPGYGAIAPTLGMSETAVKTAVHRLRARFNERLRQEIMRTVGSVGEVDGEVRYLISVSAGFGYSFTSA